MHGLTVRSHAVICRQLSDVHMLLIHCVLHACRLMPSKPPGCTIVVTPGCATSDEPASAPATGAMPPRRHKPAWCRALSSYIQSDPSKTRREMTGREAG